MEENTDEQLEEVLAPEQEDGLIEESTEESVKEETQETSPTPEDEMQEVRFKTLRNNNKQLEQQNDELNRRLGALERAQRPVPQQQPEDKYTEEVLAPDDLVEAKHLSKYDQKFTQMSKELAEYKEQVHRNTVDSRIKAKYPDFDDVVTEENMQVLCTAEPDFAKTIATAQDLYSQAATAYKLIKKLGIIPSDSAVKNAHRMAKNSEKPIPTGSVHSQATTDSPLSSANSFAEDMTKEEKQKIWIELQANAKQSR